jgi:hypothetical protein
MLTTLEAGKEAWSEEMKIFYNTTRSYILQGYTASQHFLTDIKPYQLVPGANYKGCIKVESQTLS